MLTPSTKLSLLKLPPFSYVPTRHEGALEDENNTTLDVPERLQLPTRCFLGRN